MRCFVSFMTSLIWLCVLVCKVAKSAPVVGSRNLLQSDILQNVIVHESMPSYTTSHPSSDSTRLEISNPSCFGKGSALLASFCVAPTTPEQDQDPENKLPRITFAVKRKPSSSPITLLLFDDEKNSWPSFWEMTMRNRTCEEMAAKVVVAENRETIIESYMNIMGKNPHNWYIVVVDCQKGLCPEVEGANVTFFHPNSDGSSDACSGLPQPALALKEALVEGWSALSVDNILHVAGLSPFGVAVLYMQFAVMLLFSLLFLLWGVRSDSGRRFLFWNTFFVTGISCMCYLAMATGNGILVLRRLDNDAGRGWHLSEELVSSPGSKEHPNPLYDAKVSAVPEVGQSVLHLARRSTRTPS